MDFKTFFENQDVQNRINELAVHYSGKKIVLYGAGAFANAIFENYNLSKLNIIAVADKRFENDKDCFFHGIKGISPEELKYIDCDIILISNRDYLYFKKILIDLLKKTPNELVFIEQLLRDDIEKRLQNLEKEVLLLRTLLQKSVDITKIPPAKGNLRKLQLIKTEILKKIDVILKKHNLKYWLEYGTLIGAVRHKGFIPWDDDIDIAMLKEDYMKLPEILEKEFVGTDYTVEKGALSGSEIIKIYYKGIKIDIFPMEFLNKRCETEEEKTAFIKKWFEVKELLLKKYPIELFKSRKKNHFDIQDDIKNFKKEVFGDNYKENESSSQLIRSVETMTIATVCGILEKDDIFPLKEIEFEGYKFPSPNNPLKHLYHSNEYGEYGAVMNFPKIMDSGFAHTQFDYENNEKIKKIYDEMFLENNKKRY